MLTPKRSRFLAKITGWPRIGYFRELFDDAKFIHLVRDGRAVVRSILNLDWWRGWRGPANWRWGELTEGQDEIWRRYDRSFVALAAINWNILIDAVLQTKEDIPQGAFLEIRYEDLCERPLNTLKEAVDFCGIPWCQEFERRASKYNLRNTNPQWLKEFTQKQQAIVQDILQHNLEHFGYL
jgi:hypothetical protein